MLPMPSLPTDNLYKFMAIAGLVFTAIGLVSPAIYKTDWYNDAITRSEKLDQRVAEGRLRIEEIAIRSQLTEKERSALLDRLSKQFSEDIADERYALNQQLEQRQNLADEKVEGLQWCGVAGFLVSLAGFICWYQRVQSMQDSILRMEFEKLKRQLT